MVLNTQHLLQLTLLVILTFIRLSQLCPTTQCTCTVENGKNLINCRNKGLTAIPVFTQTAEIYDEISFGSADVTGCDRCNKITVVPDNAFSNLRVKKIILTQNAVRTYSANAFNGLEDILEGLELEGDGGNSPPYGEVRTLTNLQLLHFEHFRQTSMTKGNTLSLFSKLKELRFVNIQSLDSIAFDAFLYDTTNQKKFPVLTTFVLRKVPTLTTLPVASILELTNLEHLEISDTGITQILGSSFQALTKLKNLHITYNSNLQTINSGAFAGITANLEFLFLGHNKLQNLTSLTNNNWQKLIQLNLQYNPVGMIPASSFSQMGQLAYLNLDSCQLSTIDSSIFNGLARLHTLILSNNMIQSVATASFQNSPELTELRLDKQTGTTLTLFENSFQGIETSLNRLYVQKNSIQVSLFWSLIEKFPNLLELYASDLNLASIPDKAFKNNTKLTYLDLEKNNITSIQESAFYRLRDSLETLSLSMNSIQSIDECVFRNFTKLRHLYLQQNPLICDCRIQWLYDWIQDIPSESDRVKTSFLLGACDTPASLTGSYLHLISRTALTCTGSYVPPICTDLYATTTHSITRPSTTKTTPSTPDEIPTFNIFFGKVTDTSVEVSWTVSDKTYVTGYYLEIKTNGNNNNIKNRTIHEDSESETVYNLEPATYYTFCLFLELNGQLYIQKSDCQFKRTLQTQTTVSTTLATTSQPESNIGIIAGAAVGGVVVVVVVILIVVILLRYKKPPKKPPPTTGVSFIPAPGGTLPQAGGTARRFAKPKDGKDGAIDTDEIKITTISNGDIDGKDRFSAGSYQLLNEKDFHRGPMPSTSKGHYVNDLDERPLPRTPYGAPGPSGAKSRGYVNTGFTGSTEPLPETSENTYNELYVPGAEKKKMKF